MRTIIAGSRGLGDAHVRAAMEACGWLPTAVISGKARGADEAGEKWAHERSIPVELFPAKWRELGKRAGFYRNEEMTWHAKALVAVWDGVSRGTEHMIFVARGAGLKVFVWTLSTHKCERCGGPASTANEFKICGDVEIAICHKC